MKCGLVVNLNKLKLILGSSSKYRKEVLEAAGYVFDMVSPNVDEKSIETSDPY